MLIGLSGRKNAGKGSVALALGKAHGFFEISFADKLKDFCAALTGAPREVFDDRTLRDKPIIRRSHVVRHSNEAWVSYPGEETTIRQFMQIAGTAGRDIFNSDFWVKLAMEEALKKVPGFSHYAHPNVVISDVRFKNEFDAIKMSGGVVLRLNRADRKEVHDYDEGDGLGAVGVRPGKCAWIVGFNPIEDVSDPTDASPIICDLPKESHPSHYSGDQHASETSLPDASNDFFKYDLVSEQGSGAGQAGSIGSWYEHMTGL